MQGLLIVDDDRDSRKMMADIFIDEGYTVTATSSLSSALYGILKKTAQVVLLGNRIDDLGAADIIPLLKQCNQKLNIILVAAETSLPLIRKLRKEGIFYHALKPQNTADREEIHQAVECAFKNIGHF
ncbi:response regulator [Pelotalea chapellei]|uniref:Response regulator n=1 Tax=Pelotalea chapellei TaxID=44671 RepID=A0ABS5U6W2_9BACT|nr:response regulator [Pelotalea chapellei]MBT1071398.1 response regulator [Pelotalea chapellei]